MPEYASLPRHDQRCYQKAGRGWPTIPEALPPLAAPSHEAQAYRIPHPASCVGCITREGTRLEGSPGSSEVSASRRRCQGDVGPRAQKSRKATQGRLKAPPLKRAKPPGAKRARNKGRRGYTRVQGPPLVTSSLSRPMCSAATGRRMPPLKSLTQGRKRAKRGTWVEVYKG